jgi:hypothetical protein
MRVVPGVGVALDLGDHPTVSTFFVVSSLVTADATLDANAGHKRLSTIRF